MRTYSSIFRIECVLQLVAIRMSICSGGPRFMENVNNKHSFSLAFVRANIL